LNCGQDIKKQNSLFITDLAVVEDPARTYNFRDATGNMDGEWTFGSLMYNACNGTVPLKDFLKSFVKQWIQTTPALVNDQAVESRGDGALFYIISPWLKLAYNNPYLLVNNANWEMLWDDCDEIALKRSAPFKLTAIVNRIDLRGSSAFFRNLSNAGETRFIFTLLAPF